MAKKVRTQAGQKGQKRTAEPSTTRVKLLSETICGSGSRVEVREHFADARHVTWDGRSPLRITLNTLTRKALQHAEQATGAPMVIESLELKRIWTTKSGCLYCFHAAAQHANGKGKSVSFYFDLRGEPTEMERIILKDEKEYQRYLNQI